MRATGWLFAVGSACFLVAAVAAQDSQATWIGGTFFAGSIFFTSAALLQLLAAASVPHDGGPLRRERPGRWEQRHADWIAAAVQFAGTILFNINTWDALDLTLTASENNVRVWAPDVIGSVCFLIASAAALATVQRRWLAWEPRDPDWRIGALNMLGSVFFMVSAIAAFNRPATGALVDDRLANAGTAWGALCFLIGALLLVREARVSPQDSSSS
ncbi:MAG: YrhK family protein [Solirubrobacteraceae bacterium]|nr:YrhK family protein [Solirubrobacteraceae bacterium]